MCIKKKNLFKQNFSNQLEIILGNLNLEKYIMNLKLIYTLCTVNMPAIL